MPDTINTLSPTPTDNIDLPRKLAAFETLSDALDYAAQGQTGLNFYSARGELIDVLPYAELREEAIAAARRYIALGLAPGDRVVLPADTCRSFIVEFFGCQYAALLPVPVAIPVMFGEKQDYIEGLRGKLEDASAAAAIAPDNLAPFLSEAAEGLELKFIGGASAFNALPQSSEDLRYFGPDDIAYLQYSSGSTRAPAGIEIPQKVFMANARHMARDGLQVRDKGDRCASWLPLYHDMGLVGFMMTPMTAQLTIDLMATREFARRPLTWLKLISRNRATLSYSPSFGYELCVRQAARAKGEDLDLSCWRAAGIGGDMVRAKILEDFADAFADYGFDDKAFVPSYGLAESTLACTFTKIERGAGVYAVNRVALARGEIKREPLDAPGDVARTFVGCGAVLPDHELTILDENGAPARPDQVGRIFFRGPSVMRGYFGKPEETAAALDADGWLNTGDLGFFAEGELVITGRAKDLILVNGRNIWPQDLEWAIENLPGLRRGDTAAFSLDDGGAAERVVMLVQARTSDPEKRSELASTVQTALSQTGVADPFVRLVRPSALPQTSSGKLSRARAKKNFLEGVYGDPDGPADVAAQASHAS